MPRGSGYWPALWLFGNLGRAVFQNSNTGLWPWSYNECDEDLFLPPTGPPQRISACDHYDLARVALCVARWKDRLAGIALPCWQCHRFTACCPGPASPGAWLRYALGMSS